MTPSARHAILLAGTLTLFAAGCADQNTRSTASPAPQATTTSSTAPVTPTAASERTAAGTSTQTANTTPPDKTGIPACDDYLASYKGCHRAAGIYAPDTIDAHYKDMRDTLLKESRDPSKRSALAGRCVSLAKLLKESLHGQSCAPEQPAEASSAGNP